jgi:AraC-like DNA-binding protein
VSDVQARPRRPRTETRRLPVYGAGEVTVPYRVRGTYETLHAPTTWAEHAHPTHELLWHDRGASTAVVGERVWTVTPTLGLWIPAGVRHHGTAPAGVLHRAAQLSTDATPALAAHPVAVAITPLLRLLLDRLNEPDLAEPERERSEAVVLDLVVPAPHELVLRVPTSALLAPVVAALRKNPGDTTTLAGWAARLGVSTRTLGRAFTTETGLGFSRWAATARAQRAVELIAQGEELVDVAAAVGFGSVSAFGTAFRRVTGLTPGVFRVDPHR